MGFNVTTSGSATYVPTTTQDKHWLVLTNAVPTLDLQNDATQTWAVGNVFSGVAPNGDLTIDPNTSVTINGGTSNITAPQGTMFTLVNRDGADAWDCTVYGVDSTGALAALDTVGTTEIDDEAVTLAKLAHMATDSFLGRDTAGTGDVEVLSAATARGILNVEDGSTADQTDEEIEDIVGGMLTGNTATGITVTYQDGDGTIDFVVLELGSLPVPTTNVDINDQSLLQVGAIERRVFTDTTSGTTPSLDLAEYGIFDVTMDSATVTFGFSNPAASGEESSFILYARQDGTGGRTIGFPAAVDWAGGTAPTPTTTASALDIYAFSTVDGGTTYLGTQVAADVS